MLNFRPKGFFPTILLSTLLMGSSFPSAAWLLVSGADALSLVSIRFLLASLIAWSMVGLFHNLDETIVPWRVAGLIGVFQTFGVMAPVHIALGSEAPAVVAAIVFSNVLMVAGYEMFIGRRQTTKTLLFALALGFGGLILVTNVLAMPVSNDLHASHFGVLLSLAAALSWTFATLLSKQLKIAGGWRFNAQKCWWVPCAYLGLPWWCEVTTCGFPRMFRVYCGCCGSQFPPVLFRLVSGFERFHFAPPQRPALGWPPCPRLLQ